MHHVQHRPVNGGAPQCRATHAYPIILAIVVVVLLVAMSSPSIPHQPASPRPYHAVLFSDLDGTIVHFHHELEGLAKIDPLQRDPAFNVEGEKVQPDVLYTDLASGEQRVCYTVPSSTAGPAYVSVRTHELVAELRRAGVLFVVVTAGRKSTLLSRVPMLPFSDAYCGEAGGRVLLNTASPLLFAESSAASLPAPGPTPPPPLDALQLDAEWAPSFEEISGPLDDPTPPHDRRGALWDVYRQLRGLGLKVDANSYWACFRVDLTKSGMPPSEAEGLMGPVLKDLPPTLAYTSNLGKLDFYPAVSGKGGVARHLLARFGLNRTDAFAMFDDDNDLPMAAEVGRGFVVRALTQSVEDAVRANPHWKVATRQGVLAAEDMLEAVLQTVQRA